MFLYSRFSSGQQPNKSVLLTNLVSLVVAGAFWRSLWIPMSLMRRGECGYWKVWCPKAWRSSRVNRKGKQSGAYPDSGMSCICIILHMLLFKHYCYFFFHFIYVFNVWWGTHVSHSVHAEVRGQFAGPGPLLPPAGSAGYSSGQRLGSRPFSHEPSPHLFALLTASLRILSPPRHSLVAECWGDSDTHHFTVSSIRLLFHDQTAEQTQVSSCNFVWEAESLISSRVFHQLLLQNVAHFQCCCVVSEPRSSPVIETQKLHNVCGAVGVCPPLAALMLMREWSWAGIRLSETWGSFSPVSYLPLYLYTSVLIQVQPDCLDGKRWQLFHWRFTLYSRLL